ncbi:hypothetical protein DFJ74DRAFT_758199 [Hyaloraphidium curvatum]|nr:hypothetical protein DFJ74DRAFT_758199 [Hyaloraphidium curvatum]
MAPQISASASPGARVYPTPQLKTFFGRTFWPAPIFKSVWPFLFTFTGLVFMNRALVTAMENGGHFAASKGRKTHPAIVNADTAKGKEKGEATAYYMEQRKKAEEKHH